MATLAPAARMPRRPKLRSSCDACGAAKLKCSREAECQRCQTLGIPCTYSISRKMGKPPRSKPKVATGSGAATSSTASSVDLTAAGAPDVPTPTLCPNLHVTSPSASPPFEQSLDSSLLAMEWNPPDEPMSDQLDAIFNNLAHPLSTSISNPTQDFYGEPLPRTLPDLLPKPPSSGPLGEAASLRPDWEGHTAVEQASGAGFEGVLASVELGDVVSLYSDSMASHQEGAAASISSDATYTPLAEAYRILGQLALQDLDVDKQLSSTRHSSISISTTSLVLSDIPLDRILHLSQEAREKLGHILRSACLQAPLAFLCASIVSTILRWYQQITTSIQNKPYDGPQLMTSREGTVSTGSVLTPVSVSGSCSPKSGTAAVPSSTSGLRKISIGTFSVDDRNTETLLTAQVLLSELSRLGQTIELFTQDNRPESIAGNREIIKSVHSGLVRLHMQTVNGVRELSKSMLY